jgi:hypothetical protein
MPWWLLLRLRQLATTSRAEKIRADSDVGGTFFHSYLQVVTHAHGQEAGTFLPSRLLQEDIPKLPETTKPGPHVLRVLLERRNGHESHNAEGFQALELIEAVQELGLEKTMFGWLLAQIDLEESLGFQLEPAGLLVQ